MRVAGGVADWVPLLEADFERIMSFWNLSKPSVAAVNGPALAGGFELMMGCDLAVAIETAVFGDTIPTSIFCCDAGGMVVICAGATGYSAVMHGKLAHGNITILVGAANKGLGAS